MNLNHLNLIITKFFLIIFLIVTPNIIGSKAQWNNSYVKYDITQNGYINAKSIVEEFFNYSDFGECSENSFTSYDCKMILEDGLLFQSVSSSLSAFPAPSKNSTYTLKAQTWGLNPDFDREKVREILPKLYARFKCIDIGCNGYSNLPADIRTIAIRGHKQAIAYMHCLMDISDDSFNKQALIAMDNYYKFSNRERINKRLIEANQFGSKHHRFLFIEPDHFEECKNIGVSYNSLNLIMRFGKSMRPGSF